MIVRIILLKKSQKLAYTIAGVYYPIFLFTTLKIILELIIAQRLAFLADKYSFLPYITLKD